MKYTPVDKTCKIRSIQVHGKDAEECFAGQRVAINLSNIKKNEIHRGCVLAPVNSMKNTMMLDVRLRVLPSSNRVIDNRTRLHLFTGTSEVLCRAVLLDKDEIGPGESGLAQLRLEGEIAVRRGDRFIVRFYSPMETIGGGVVIEANPAKKKRFDERAISEMTVKEEGGHGDMIELIIKQHSDSAITAAEVAKLTGLTAEETMAEVEKLAEQGLVATFPMKKDIYLMHASYRDKVADDMVAYLEDFHKKNPYRLGSRKAELRVRFLSKLKQNVFDEFMQRLEDTGRIKRSGEFICEGGYEIPHDEVYKQFESALTAMLDKAGFEFIRLADIQFPGIQPAMAEDTFAAFSRRGKGGAAVGRPYYPAQVYRHGCGKGKGNTGRRGQDLHRHDTRHDRHQPQERQAAAGVPGQYTRHQAKRHREREGGVLTRYYFLRLLSLFFSGEKKREKKQREKKSLTENTIADEKSLSELHRQGFVCVGV